MRRIFLLLPLLFLSVGCGKKSARFRGHFDPLQRVSEQEAASLDALSVSSADNLEAGAAAYAESEAKPTPPESVLASRAAYNTGTVFLMNDSPFLLSATVLAADGSYLGQVSVQPGQQVTFTQSLSATSYQFPGKPRVSLTPFTVIWQCPSRGYYSVCRMVSPGSAVMANDCSGNHFCEPKKEQAPATKLEKKSD